MMIAEMLVPISQTTLYHITEDCNLSTHHYENLRYQMSAVKPCGLNPFKLSGM
jgi:hypothetical protein